MIIKFAIQELQRKMQRAESTVRNEAYYNEDHREQIIRDIMLWDRELKSLEAK